MIVGDCILWAGRIEPKGYGRLGGKRAHRIAYEQAKGPIPAGLTIDHLCRNRACVNPDHLEAVTNRENILRGGNAQKTHCRNGHPFDEENTYWVTKRGPRRHCRACNRAAVAAYKKRKQP